MDVGGVRGSTPGQPAQPPERGQVSGQTPGPTSPANNPALAGAPAAGAQGDVGGRRTSASFSAKGAIDPEAASMTLADQAKAVTTLDGLKVLLDGNGSAKLGTVSINMLPPDHQVRPISLLGASVEQIQPESDRLAALREVIRATAPLAAQGGANCGPIIQYLPFTVDSLAAADRRAGYTAARNALDNAGRRGGWVGDAGQRGRQLGDESYATGLAGLAYTLHSVPDRSQDVREVSHILSRLGDRSEQHSAKPLGVLAEQRFRLSPDAAEIVTRRALETAASDALGPEERAQIHTGLIGGLKYLASGERFDAEFSTLYRASKNEADPQIRMSMLAGLAGYCTRLSPEHAAGAERVIHDELVELGNAAQAQATGQLHGGADMNAAIEQMYEQAFEMLPQHPDIGERVNVMGALAQNLHTLSDIDQDGPMTNPRVMNYVRLGEMMLGNWEAAKGGPHEQAFEEINGLMAQARSLLKPAEIEVIDRALIARGFTPPAG